MHAASAAASMLPSPRRNPAAQVKTKGKPFEMKLKHAIVTNFTTLCIIQNFYYT